MGQPAGRVVVVLGAGASADCGCPIMSRFFLQAQNLYWARKLTKAAEDFRSVQDARTYLERAYSRANIDIDNLESVFTALEMGEFLATGAKDVEWFGEKRSALIRVIAATLEQSTEFGVCERELRPKGAAWDCVGVHIHKPKNPIEHATPGSTVWYGVPCLSDERNYDHLVTLRRRLLESSRCSHVDFVTFNYDLALDVTLVANATAFNYALNGLPGDQECLVAKLHGSLNWYLDETEKAQRIKELPEWKTKAVDVRRINPNQEGDEKRFLSLSLGEDAGGKPREPFIIPPSESKRQGRQRIQSVWQAAADRLRRADTIVFIGFSLPPTDVFFREFFAMGSVHAPKTGTNGDENILRRIVVIDPGKNVEERYRDVFAGHAAKVAVFRPFRMIEELSSTKPDAISALLLG